MLKIRGNFIHKVNLFSRINLCCTQF